MPILVGLSSAGFAPASAAKTWLDFINLGQLNSNTRLRIQCEGSEPYDELKCRVTAYQLFKPADEDGYRFRTQVTNIDAKSDAEPNQQRPTISPAEAAGERARMAAATPEQRAAWADWYATRQTFAAAKTRSELKSALAQNHEMEAGTCRISADESEFETFRRVTKHRWEFRAGPSHDCHVSQVFSLENEPDNAAAWTYSETVTSSDNEGECSIWGDRVQKPIAYSGDAPNLFAGCKYIVMGQ